MLTLFPGLQIPVYEFLFGGDLKESVMRRRHDDWINATHILKAAGFDKVSRNLGASVCLPCYILTHWCAHSRLGPESSRERCRRTNMRRSKADMANIKVRCITVFSE